MKEMWSSMLSKKMYDAIHEKLSALEKREEMRRYITLKLNMHKAGISLDNFAWMESHAH